jgi:tetratricopeptide (TPR) repeat protein
MNKPHFRWPNLLALTLCLVSGAGCTDASKARRVLAAADSDFQDKKYDQAEAEYKSVLRLSSFNPAAIRQLGFIYFDEGRQTAFIYLKKANDLDNTNHQVQLDLAELYGNGGRTKEATGLLGLVLQADPGNEHALLLMAQFVQTNDLPNLRQRLQTQLREGGRGPAACHSALGWIDLRMQRVADAETEFLAATALDPKLVSPHLGMAVIYAAHKDTKELEQALKAAAELSPIRSVARLKYAEFEIQSGKDAQARQLLLDITTQAPDYMPAELYLMRLSFANRKYDECKATIDKILARDNSPPNFEAAFQSGMLALEQRDVAKALSTFQHLDESYRLYSTNHLPPVKYYLAEAHLMNHETQKAIGDLNDALALDSEYFQAVLLRADLDYRSGGNLTEAVTLLSRYLGVTNVSATNMAIGKHLENAKAQLELADIFLAQERPDRALEVYQQMAKSFTKNAEIPRLMGVIFAQAHDTDDAYKAYKQSLDLEPGYLPTMENITDLDILLTNFAEAHRRVTEEMANNPKSSELTLLQGKIYLYEGQSKQAEAAYSKAIELNPQLPEAYLALARLYLNSHQEQQALDRLNALVGRTNDLSTMLLIGEIHQSGGRYDQARAMYEKVLSINPEFGPALNNLAYLDSEFLGNVEKARQLAETARNLRPTDPNAADTLGWILFKQHQYAHALSLIKESAEKLPNDPEVQMHLGLAYYMMEEEKPARIYLKRALDSKVDFRGKDLARRRLDVLDIDPSKATPAVVQQLQDLLKEDPKDPVPLSRLASIQEKAGDFQKAADTLQTLISINPENWPAMMRLSRLYADHLNDLRKARDLAKSAHDLALDDGRTSALLGELVYRSGDYSWSMSLLEDAANRSPDQPSVFYQLALAYYAVGRVNDADTAMQKAVQSGGSFPNIEQAKQFQTLREAVKDPAQAEAAGDLAKQILQKEPNNVPALMVSALLSERAGATNEAEQIWQKVLVIYPRFAPAMRELAIHYSHSPNAADQKKAYDFAQDARASMPDDLRLAKTLGILAYGQTHYDISMRELRQCVEKSAPDGEVFYYLGMDYIKLKQRNDSKQALQQALKLGLADNLAGQARDTLKDLK